MSQVSQSAVKLGLWLSFAAFIVVVLVFRSKITSISFGPSEGVKASMAGTDEVRGMSDKDRENGSGELLRRLNTLEQQVRTQPAAAATMPASYSNSYQPPAIPNLGGLWTGATGLTYQVTQYGNYLTVQEQNPMWGMVTAVATGQILGRTFSLLAYALPGSYGMLSLQVSEDDRHMTGQFRDSVTGNVAQLQLSR